MTTTLPQPPTARPERETSRRTADTAPAKPRTRPAAKGRPAGGARTRAPHPAPRAPRTPFVLLVVGLLGGALVSLLLLNTVLAEDAFRLHDLQRQNTQMLQHEQALKVDVSKAESPAELARRAKELGMRPGPMTPRFVDTKPAGASGAAGTPGKRHAAGEHAKPRAGKHVKKHARAHATRKPTADRRSRHHARPSAAPSTGSGDHAFAGNGR